MVLVPNVQWIWIVHFIAKALQILMSCMLQSVLDNFVWNWGSVFQFSVVPALNGSGPCVLSGSLISYKFGLTLQRQPNYQAISDDKLTWIWINFRMPCNDIVIASAMLSCWTYTQTQNLDYWIFVWNKTFRILTLSYITEIRNWIFGNFVINSVLFSVSWLAFSRCVLSTIFGNFWLGDNTKNERTKHAVMQGAINLCLLILLIASIIGEFNGVEMDEFFPPFRQFFSRSTFISRRSWIREFRLQRKSLSSSEFARELSEWTNRRKHRTGSSSDHIISTLALLNQINRRIMKMQFCSK